MDERIHVKPLINELNRRAARAVIGQLGLRSVAASKYLSSIFEKLPGERGSFFASPVFEATFGWQESDVEMSQLEGSLYSKDVLSALNSPPKKPEDLTEYRFPLDRRPYTHQLESWKILLSDEIRSVLVTSGTGSGKTECFLLPIIEDLYREHQETNKPLVGVRALFLYPLNALINSQRERLKAWTSGFEDGVRFCLYNGETPNKRTKASEQKLSPEEVKDRIILRENPPPILVTNSTMLEYMLVRKDDVPIVEQSQGTLRWIVLDEAHSYVGSQSAELALLLRRVMVSFGVEAKNVRFVATSATIGGGDEKSVAELRKFLSDVGGVSESQVHVVQGQRDIPKLLKSSQPPSKIDDICNAHNKEAYRMLASFKPAIKIREKLTSAPYAATTDQLVELTKPSWPEVDKQKVWNLIDCMAGAKEGANTFLPIRTHLFQKTLDGIYVCTNPNCSSRAEELLNSDWPFGQIFLSERDFCSCESPVQPLVSCNSCGQEYLDADERLEKGKYFLYHPERHDDGDEFIWDIEQTENSEERNAALDTERVILAATASPNLTPFRIQKSTRELASENSEIELYGRSASEFVCTTCKARDRADWKVFVPKRLGAPFFLGDSLPTLLEYSPKHGDGPFNSRRLLTFTDSRQGTARIAARLQQDVDRNKVRSVLYHQVHIVPDAPDEELVKKLESEIAALKSVAGTNAAIDSILVEKREKLDNLSNQSTQIVSWRDAEAALNNSVDISYYMFDAFREIAGEFITKSEFGHFCLMREFMRRPVRGFQLETLGLVDLFYPKIEELTSVPRSWAQQYSGGTEANEKALKDWKDWLTILADMHFRANSAVDFNQSWGKLMGAVVNRKFAVGPTSEEQQYVQRWPSARRSTNSRVVALLTRGFKLDVTDQGTIDYIEQILEDSWHAVKRTVLNPHDNNRFLLNLRDSASFRSVSRAYKCPYSHRLVTRTFRDQSPNTTGREEIALPVAPITLPGLPFPHQTNNAGRAKIINWLESDSELKKARELAVWPNRADRIAAGEPWFRIAEHSAQLSSTQLKKYERLFKNGKLNVLSCSTTMEMGVDIGGMSVVAMNNVPPHPANYLQRTGRAGRRNEPSSASYTLCKSSSHSMQVFSDPLWPFRPGQIAAPRVSLESSNIVQRHVNSLLLSHWLKSSNDNILKLSTGWFFVPGEDEISKVDEFIAWCKSIKSHQDFEFLERGVASITIGTRLSNKSLAELSEKAAEIVDGVQSKWWLQYIVLVEDLRVLTEGNPRSEKEPAVKAINISMSRMRDEYLLGDLADGGFLPGYGFPTHVVSLNTINLEKLKRRQSERREDNRLSYGSEPSRDLAVALREYAPGAEVVIKGLVYRSAGVTLNWHKPSNIDAVPEIQNIFFHWDCKHCGEFGDSQHLIKGCPHCSASGSNFDVVESLEPAGFSIDLFADTHTNVNKPTFLPYEDAKVAAVDADWLALPNKNLGSLRYSEQGLVSYMSNGINGCGYTLCLACGRAEPQNSEDEPVGLVAGPHKRLRGGKGRETGADCSGPENPYLIKQNLRLSSKVQTSVFELKLCDPRNQFNPVQDPVIGWTVGYALRNALCGYLGISEQEVDISLRDLRYENGEAGFTLCLFDTASQGAGFVERLQEELVPLLHIARKNLDCSAECDSVCQHCLLDAKTQYKESNLNRHEAIAWLDAWLESVQLPKELRFFGESSVAALSTLQYQIALTSRVVGLEKVQIFVEATEEDNGIISSWSMMEVTQNLIKSGVTVEWIIPSESVQEVTETFGATIYGVKSVYGDALQVSVSNSSNIIGDQGKLILCAHTDSHMKCWAGLNPSLGMNKHWGSSQSPVITTSSFLNSIDFQTSALEMEALLPESDSTSISLRLVNELDGSARGFGNRFVGYLSEKHPELGRKIVDPSITVEKLIYSDRYLRAPLHLLLLNQILQSVIGSAEVVNCPVRVITTFYPKENRPPARLYQNFQDSKDFDQLFSILLSDLSDRASITRADRKKIGHARTLFIQFSDSSSYEVDFDQGMGSWKLLGGESWQAYAPVTQQANKLACPTGTIRIGGDWGTVINIRKRK